MGTVGGYYWHLRSDLGESKYFLSTGQLIARKISRPAALSKEVASILGLFRHRYRISENNNQKSVLIADFSALNRLCA